MEGRDGYFSYLIYDSAHHQILDDLEIQINAHLGLSIAKDLTLYVADSPIPLSTWTKSLMANIAPDTIDRFSFIRDLDDNKMWSYEHVPCLGLLSIEPLGLVLSGQAFDIFSPVSLVTLRKIQKGDLLRVTTDLEHKSYKVWNAPASVTPPANFQSLFRVIFVATDSKGYPLVVATVSL